MAGTTTHPTRMITIKQAASITALSTRTIRRRISDGSLPAYKVGPRHIRIRLEDLQRLARPIPSARTGRRS